MEHHLLAAVERTAWPVVGAFTVVGFGAQRQGAFETFWVPTAYDAA